MWRELLCGGRLNRMGRASDQAGRLPARSTTKVIARTPWALPLCLVLLASMLAARAYADPADPPDPPLPAFANSSNWTPKYPHPFDESRKNVTNADITAEREMCQWFNAQYNELTSQLDRFGYNLLDANNDWTVGQIQAQGDAVSSHVDQTEAFLAPRAQALTEGQDFANDLTFNIYQGESFYRLWQDLSNVGTGIKSHSTAWVNGPAVQRVKHWGSRIHRSHVCD
jgi:hypothetical protein